MSNPHETQFLAALADAEFPVSSVVGIRDLYDPLPSSLAELLLEWIPRLEDRRLQESVAWALLAAPKGTLDGAKLAELFDAATSDDLKHALAAVIHQTRPRKLDSGCSRRFEIGGREPLANICRRRSRKCCRPNERSRHCSTFSKMPHWRPCIRSAKLETATCETFSRRHFQQRPAL